MYLGIDVGTSAVKVVLVDDADRVRDQASAPLEVRRPRPLWSEQDPEQWWTATDRAVGELRARQDLRGVRSIGLSGQMHGATLLDASDGILRPAILWNDGRSFRECAELEERAPSSRTITGNLAMPGFTAPKLVWVRRHEPDVFARVARVLLPKDWLRWKLTGDYASDRSDSAGTLWLDVGARDWSDEMLAACELSRAAMPALFEGPEPTGALRADVARSWGLERVPVAAGAGDNAAGAVGLGVVDPGDAFLSLGTSGVAFVAGDRFRPNPSGGVHAFCHCLPESWHQMSVILSAASCLAWVTKLTGASDEGQLLDEIEAHVPSDEELLFLPYLSGERTPHNDPEAQGAFVGLTHATTRASLGRAVLEGVAFAFRDGQSALVDAGTTIDAYDVIGGGARSVLWVRILAAVLDRPLVLRAERTVGPAFGAARLARMACTGEPASTVCTAPPVDGRIEPDAELRDRYAERYAAYRALYPALRPFFARGSPR